MRAFLLGLALVLTAPGAHGKPMFVGLGDLAVFSSTATGISGDGSVVVGQSESASGIEAFRWTSGGGMVGLGDLAGGSFSSVALGVSGDGSVVVGYGNSTSGPVAFVLGHDQRHAQPPGCARERLWARPHGLESRIR